MSSFQGKTRSSVDRKTTGRIRTIGTIIAVLIAIFPPVVYYYFSFSSQQQQLRIETEVESRYVTNFINRTPNLWKYDKIRLRGLLSMEHHGKNEIRRILDEEGYVVLQVGTSFRNPFITSSYDLMDAGRVVGKYEITRSIRPILIRSGWTAVGSSLLALLGLLFFKTFPLKSLSTALKILAEERDRAHVTLASIGDCVIITDENGNLATINRVGERLTGWKEDDARGKPRESSSAGNG
jgi:PAS domain-containing protein